MSYDLWDSVFLSSSFQQPSLYGDPHASLSLSGEVVQELGNCGSGGAVLHRSVMEEASQIELTGYAEASAWMEVGMFLAGTCSTFQIQKLRLREVRFRQPEPRALKLDTAS